MQLDDLAIGPVEILDPQHERIRPGQHAEVPAPAVDDLVLTLPHRQPRQLGARHEPGAVSERGRHAMSLRGVRQQRRQAGRQILEGHRGPPGRQELPEGAARLGLAGRAAPRLDHPRRPAESGDELLDQPGLPLPGRAGHEGEDGSPRPRAGEGEPQHGELGLAAHERHATRGARPGEPHEPPRGDRPQPLQLDLAQADEVGGVRGRLAAGRAQDDLARLRERQEARRHVHARPDAHLLAFGLRRRQVDDGLAGLHARAHLERHGRAGARVRPPAHAGVGGPERALRIVRMGGGHAEERVDRVADVLLDGPALGGDERGQLREGPVEGSLHALGPEPLRERGRADDVDEERGHHPSLEPLLAHIATP
jgi:hypothetical protein